MNYGIFDNFFIYYLKLYRYNYIIILYNYFRRCKMRRKNRIKKTSFFRTPLFRTTLRIALGILLLSSLLINLFTHLTPVVKYYGTGMAPTLEDGQLLIVSKISKIKSGDIVAFYINNKVLVRRVVATENEQISIDLYGTISVNGEPLEEPYLENKTRGQCNQHFPYNVPTDCYFVVGDNRAASMDSRLTEIGAIDEDQMIGKVILTF